MIRSNIPGNVLHIIIQSARHVNADPLLFPLTVPPAGCESCFRPRTTLPQWKPTGGHMAQYVHLLPLYSTQNSGVSMPTHIALHPHLGKRGITTVQRPIQNKQKHSRRAHSRASERCGLA